MLSVEGITDSVMVISETLRRSQTEKLVRDDLPLAVYREVAAHLRQVLGVEVTLEPRRSPKFDYFQSQVGAMLVSYPEDLSGGDRQKIENILNFYGDRHGAWQREKLA